jgi:hypothetical protein
MEDIVIEFITDDRVSEAVYVLVFKLYVLGVIEIEEEIL